MTLREHSRERERGNSRREDAVVLDEDIIQAMNDMNDRPVQAHIVSLFFYPQGFALGLLTTPSRLEEISEEPATVKGGRGLVNE